MKTFSILFLILEIFFVFRNFSSVLISIQCSTWQESKSASMLHGCFCVLGHEKEASMYVKDRGRGKTC